MSRAGIGDTLPAVGDERLMEQIKNGSVDAFGALYGRYCDRAYRLAWSVCRDDGRAEEAVQEAFLSLWRHGAAYVSQRGTVAGWLLTVVRNRAVDIARRDAKHGERWGGDEAALEAQAAAEEVAEEALARDQAGRLQALLGRIPDAQCEVIVLAFYGGLSHTEIADALGLPAGTVKGRMRLGLNKLRVCLERASG